MELLSVIYPGQVLFGLTVVLFGSAFTLSFLMRSKAEVVRPLRGVLFVILFLLIGTVAIEFSGAATPSYTFGQFSSLSEALSTHRWLLFQLPILLTITSLMVLTVYGEHIAHKHAWHYRASVIFSIAVSFASVVMILLESMV